jgi:Glycosyl hydrolase family 76
MQEQDMSNPYIKYARSAVNTLTSKWFAADTPSYWVPQDYWKTPTICQELVFYMELAGESSYVSTLENARVASEYYLNNCSYYDDLTCWGRFFISAHNYLKSGGGVGADPANYLNDAITTYSNLTAAFTDGTACGGVWWKRFPPSYPDNFKASNATLGLMEIALGLYFATKQQQYLDTGRKAWEWLQNSKMIDAKGYVWGGLNEQCGIDCTNQPVVALQGNPLAPLWMLYQVTGDTSCLDTAQTIVGLTMQKMVWQNTQILLTTADAGWNCQNSDWQEQYLGETLFKGIFMGFLGNFTKSLQSLEDPSRKQAAQQYAAFLQANADAVWANFPGGNFGMDWHTPSPNYQVNPDDIINACLQYSAVAAFVAAAQCQLS